MAEKAGPAGANQLSGAFHCLGPIVCKLLAQVAPSIDCLPLHLHQTGSIWFSLWDPFMQ